MPGFCIHTLTERTNSRNQCSDTDHDIVRLFSCIYFYHNVSTLCLASLGWPFDNTHCVQEVQAVPRHGHKVCDLCQDIHLHFVIIICCSRKTVKNIFRLVLKTLVKNNFENWWNFLYNLISIACKRETTQHVRIYRDQHTKYRSMSRHKSSPYSWVQNLVLWLGMDFIFTHYQFLDTKCQSLTRHVSLVRVRNILPVSTLILSLCLDRKFSLLLKTNWSVYLDTSLCMHT